MTKEITKARIIQEISDKFKLREFEPEKFCFSELVVPTYDVGQHLLDWGVSSKTLSITSTGAKQFIEVPQDERWTMRSYMLIFYNEGAYQVSGLYVGYRPSIAGNYIYLDLEKNQASSYLVNLPTPVVLQPSNRLFVYVDTYVSTADLELIIDVQKEEIR